MRFYEVKDDEGTVLGCRYTLREAKELGRSYKGSFRVWRVTVPVSAESIRRILGGDGYAQELKEVYVHDEPIEPIEDD